MRLIKDIPNTLTVLRIILIPVIILAFFMESETGNILAAAIFIFACITDYLDGVLARRLKAHSSFGRMLDPIADKMLVAATLVMMVDYEKCPVIPAILILSREIFVSGLREYLAGLKLSMPVTSLSKLKTAIQFIAITILIISEKSVYGANLYTFGEVSIWVAAGLTLFTGYAHCRVGFKHIN